MLNYDTVEGEKIQTTKLLQNSEGAPFLSFPFNLKMYRIHIYIFQTDHTFKIPPSFLKSTSSALDLKTCESVVLFSPT